MAEHKQGITPTDLHEMRRVFTRNGLRAKNHAFRYNPTTDSWELHDVSKSTVVSARDPITGIWS